VGSGTVEFRLDCWAGARGFQARELYYWRSFADFTVKAKITLDATELGDLLALAEIPYRWGWGAIRVGRT